MSPAEQAFTWAAAHWKATVDFIIIGLGIYGVWRLIRATRGAKALFGVVLALLVVVLIAHLLDLQMTKWLFRSLSLFIGISLVILFQTELRRALGSLGSDRLLSLVAQDRASVEVLAEATFELANRQLGALIAVERKNSLEEFAESGVLMDAILSQELLVTIFHPKTPLHDGGVIVRNDRIVSAASIWPVTQRADLDRNLGLRHRAGLGLTEEYDPVVIIVSEETGIVSICHHGIIERNFDPESLKTRLDELLLTEEVKEEEPLPRSSGIREVSGIRRRHGSGSRAEEKRDDRIAF
ncbi:MAG TPA: diadenylate cyclase CdaA [Chthoniobacteraceae bacterium]|jgi:diadenylate cyclase|nr:diadenylate cyclase CdaA [Chthoniobacteraceae bacterium]